MSDYRELRLRSIEKFRRRFVNLRFSERAPVQISSGYDKTTFLVGSTISVFKPDIYSICSSRKSLFLIQDVIRTRPLAIHNNMEIPFTYGSFWTSCGTLAPPDKLGILLSAAIQYIGIDLKIPLSSIVVRASARDKQLLRSLDEFGKILTIELDKEEPNYYRHQFGIPGLLGSNMNLAARVTGTSQYLEFGSIVLIYNNVKVHAVEFAVSPSALWSFYLGFRNTYGASPIADFLQLRTEKMLRIADCLSVIAVLEAEDIRPNSSSMPGRIMREYIKSLGILCKRLDPNSLYLIEAAYERFGFEYLNKVIHLRPSLSGNRSADRLHE